MSFPSELQSGFNEDSNSNRGFPAPRKPQAARPPAGSSPIVHLAEVQERAVLCDIETVMKAGRMNDPVHFAKRWRTLGDKCPNLAAKCRALRCCLTLPSSGPPPAWPAPLPRFMLRYAGQAGGGPLMSNVRPHVNQFLLNAALVLPAPNADASVRLEALVCVCGKHRSFVPPSQRSKCTGSAHCPRLLAGLGLRRPPVRWRAAHRRRPWSKSKSKPFSAASQQRRRLAE